jgi:dephospho-CoA kinase
VIVVGLTGSIGMGKSTTAALFAEEGAAVFDADAAVAALYGPNGAAVEPIAQAFPGCASRAAGVDRAALSEALQKDASLFERLEHIVHPLVAQARADFFQAAESQGKSIVILDVPLLFETGQADQVDAVIVVSAPEAVQRRRVLERPGMTAAKLDAILARQTPDSHKRAKADFVIETSHGLDAARREVRAILATLKERNS